MSVSTLNPVYFHCQQGATSPRLGSPGSAGWDLFPLQSLRIQPLQRALIDTGIIVIIPQGYYGRVAPRSGLAIRESVDIAGGVVDSDYRGTIGVIVVNNSNRPFVTSPGVAIAQLVIECLGPGLQEVKDRDTFFGLGRYRTERAANGFGSTTAVIKTPLEQMHTNRENSRQVYMRRQEKQAEERVLQGYCAKHEQRLPSGEPCPWCVDAERAQAAPLQALLDVHVDLINPLSHPHSRDCVAGCLGPHSDDYPVPGNVFTGPHAIV